MGYAATTGFILYWNPDHNFVIHRAHYVLFDSYNYRLSIEDNDSPGYLLLHQDPESLLHNSDLLNLIPCELDLTSNQFSDTTILTYEIWLPPSEKKIGFNLLDYEYFTILHVIGKIKNPPSSHQLPTQAKKMCE